MVGGGLKKLALENALKVAGGIAFGNRCDFAASMSEGSGYKQITFSTAIVDSQWQF